MAERKFTWLPKFTRALERIRDPAARGWFALVLVSYGTTGEEPELEWPYDLAFEALRDDIDNSVAARSAGSRGGRPARARAQAAPEGDAGASDKPPSKPPFAGTETPLSEGGEGGSPSIPIQSIPNHIEKEKDAGARGRGAGDEFDPTAEGFVEPTPERVAAEAQLRGCGGVDAAGFVDYYASQGWVKANGQPVRDWRRLLPSWRNGDAERAARQRRGGAGEVSGDGFARFDDPDAPVVDARALVGGAA